MSVLYRFIGKSGKYKVPKDAVVKLIKHYPGRKSLVEYQGEQFLTMSTLLRRI